MKIRSKLLLLLLVMAVLPLLGSALFAHLSAVRLGGDLASDRRAILTEGAKTLLSTLVDAYGKVVSRDKNDLAYAVEFQAREVEQRLASPPPKDATLHFSEDYDRGENLPNGMMPSPRHFRLDADGNRVATPVTYDEQVYFVVKSVSEQAVGDQLQQLATMPEAYKFIHQTNPELMYWQYTAMESGFHTSYPGHGGYPAEYDPRVRQWYQSAKIAGATIWIVMPEVSTRTVALTVATPVHHPDGSFAGVTAIDVPLTALFQSLQLRESWSQQAETMLVVAAATFDADDRRALIVAHQSYEGHVTDWRKPVELEYLTSEDGDELGAMLNDVRTGRSGVRRMPFNGRDALWAYGTGDVFPVVIVPYDVIVEPATRAEQYVLGQVRRAQIIIGCIVIGLIVLVTVVALISSRAVTRPANDLADAAGRLAEGDYEARAEIHTGDEMQELAEVFNTVGPQLKERERIKHALGLAMEVQQNLLPSAMPQLEHLDIAGQSTYCDETGGDYYDFLGITGIGERAIAFAIGDVMGHGVAAAMLMATARGILRSRSRQTGGLDDLLTHMNDLLVEDTAGHRFMTMVMVVFDTERKVMQWASAGHDLPLLYDARDDRFIELDGGGLPLGILPDEQYEQMTVGDVHAGQVCVIATDGVWEARNTHGEEFGRQRLRELIRRCADLTSEQISAQIHQTVTEFRGETEQLDDITFVVVKVK